VHIAAVTNTQQLKSGAVPKHSATMLRTPSSVASQNFTKMGNTSAT
jgi:hypothetical protein